MAIWFRTVAIQFDMSEPKRQSSAVAAPDKRGRGRRPNRL
jgi:hypothetical protein